MLTATYVQNSTGEPDSTAEGARWVQQQIRWL